MRFKKFKPIVKMIFRGKKSDLERIEGKEILRVRNENQVKTRKS